MTLNTIWFILIFVLLAGYAVLDGFDLGVGVLTLFTKADADRRIFINAIAPVWDGNEVWLLTGGGALFAAFPPVYAAVFSGFYLALMAVLAALIFRAVAMEFRGKVDNPAWRRFWDLAFGISSFLLPILFGVALANVLRGIELTPDRMYAGSFSDLLNPFALIVGLLTLAAFTMHGSIYLCCKHTSDVTSLGKHAQVSWCLTLTMFIIATFAGAHWAAPVFERAMKNSFAWPFVILLIISTVSVPFSLRRARYAWAFVGSSAMLVSMMDLAAVGLFPCLLPATNDPLLNLTIYNSSSTHLTLLTMLIIALIGMPCVIIYTAVIHHIFRGKVVIMPDSY